MYCNTCGTYSSGPHTCPVEAASETGAVTTLPPAGWYPDPATSGLPLAGPHSTPYGRLLGIIPRTMGRKGRFDVLVYERALVLSRDRGVNPMWFVVFGLLPYVIVDMIAASGNPSRTAELWTAAPDEILSRHKHNRLIPMNEITAGRARTYGQARGNLRLEVAGSKRVKRSWTRANTRGVDVASLLETGFRGRIPVRRRSGWMPTPALAIFGGLLLFLVVLGTLAAGIGSVADARSMRDAKADVAPVCRSFRALDERVSQGEKPSAAELTSHVDAMQTPFTKAAQTNTKFGPADDAVNRIVAAFHGGPPLSAAQFETDFTTVGAACDGRF